GARTPYDSRGSGAAVSRLARSAAPRLNLLGVRKAPSAAIAPPPTRAARPWRGVRLAPESSARSSTSPVFMNHEHQSKEMEMANLTKWRLWAVATVLALAWGNAWAMSVAPTNLVDLLSNSVAIFRGSVTVVSDGVDQRGLPYTEVSVNISESLFGNQSGTF